MKAVVVFVLLFAVVFCHPVKRSASSSESSEEQSVTQLNLKFAAVTDVVPTTVDNTEDDDSDDDDDDDDAQSDDDDKDDTSESDESQETTTSIPFLETTQAIYVDTGRGDSMGFYSDSKKSIYYEKGNYIEKEPLNYKSYGFEKIEEDPASKGPSDLKVYKILQVHDVVDQGMGTSSGTESEDPSESEQVDPQQDQGMKTAATAVDDNSSPESSEESSEETATVAPSTDGVNLRTGNIETVDSDSSNTSSQSSEVPVVLTK